VVRYALLALESMDKVDDSLYERFVANRTTQEEPAVVAKSMRELWNTTFRPLTQLLSYCRKLGASRRPEGAANTPAESESLDLGDFGAGSEEEFAIEAIEASDIGDLVEGLGSELPVSEADRWAEAVEKIAGIHYGLASQFQDATERLGVALGAGHLNQALGLLDEATSTSNEGIHALVVAVYEAFVADADPASVVPAYKTTLKRALAVRRGVATLLSDLIPLNSVLQGEEKQYHPDAHFAVQCALHAYVSSPVCHAMRAGDRWEITQFERRLGSEPVTEARLTTEGLVKYLESLGVVNQREVLVQHDRGVASEIREAITTARELADLSARTAQDIIVKACAQAQELVGRSALADQQLKQLKSVVDNAESVDIQALVQRLEQLLAAAGL